MFENVRLAIQGVWSHKLRSLLTMLGIIIGISAIMAIVATIEGTNKQIKDNLVGVGTTTVQVSLTQDGGEFDAMWGTPPKGIRPLNKADLAQLKELPHVKAVSLYRCARYLNNQVTYRNTTYNGQMLGVQSAYFNMKKYQLVQGSYFAPEHYTKHAKAIVLDEAALQSMQIENPIGKVIDINRDAYTIIGVVKPSASSQKHAETFGEYYMQNQNARPTIFIPLDTWDMVFKFDDFHSVLVQADEVDNMPKAGKAVADQLNNIFGWGKEEKVKYSSMDMSEQAQQLQQLANATNQQLMWIASISLLVGGIGVMNIMLVSVTERTREIGLKKALGARKKHIITQFLVEAGTLTFIGGLLGVLVGIGLAKLISHLTATPTVFSVPISILAVLFSMLIGIVFGLLPAMKAAKLDPIVALRRE